MHGQALIRIATLPDDLRQFHMVGRVLVWSLRHWVLAQHNGTVPACVWRTLARAWRSEEVCRDATSLWSAMHTGARKSIVIRSPLEQQLSVDERMIVAALAASRERLPELVRWFLADLLRDGALDEACRGFARLGARIRELPCAEPHDTVTIGDACAANDADATGLSTVTTR